MASSSRLSQWIHREGSQLFARHLQGQHSSSASSASVQPTSMSATGCRVWLLTLAEDSSCFESADDLTHDVLLRPIVSLPWWHKSNVRRCGLLTLGYGRLMSSSCDYSIIIKSQPLPQQPACPTKPTTQSHHAQPAAATHHPPPPTHVRWLS